MDRLAYKIVDGLLGPNPNEIDSFVQGALSTNFSQFMSTEGKSSSWPAGIVGLNFRRAIESDNNLVKVVVNVFNGDVVGISNPERGTKNVHWYVSVRPTKENTGQLYAPWLHWEIKLTGLNDSEAEQASQITYQWITVEVPYVLNSSHARRSYAEVSNEIESRLKSALGSLRKGLP